MAAEPLETADEAWTPDDLEAAYQQALAALDQVDSEILATAGPESSGESSEPEQISTAAESPSQEIASGPEVSAPQVIEACLFVGGPALTAAKLASILKGDYSAAYVENVIEQLNGRYRSEGRPYHITLGEGGYRLALQGDYERLRHKVYGLGPREVRLSQESIEVLALVAYHQPIAEPQMEELGKPLAGPTLRQLLRRDLVSVERNPEEPKLVRYITTPRFLSLFGLGSLDDLPRPEELLYK